MVSLKAAFYHCPASVAHWHNSEWAGISLYDIHFLRNICTPDCFVSTSLRVSLFSSWSAVRNRHTQVCLSRDIWKFRAALHQSTCCPGPSCILCIHIVLCRVHNNLCQYKKNTRELSLAIYVSVTRRSSESACRQCCKPSIWSCSHTFCKRAWILLYFLF